MKDVTIVSIPSNPNLAVHILSDALNFGATEEVIRVAPLMKAKHPSEWAIFNEIESRAQFRLGNFGTTQDLCLACIARDLSTSETHALLAAASLRLGDWESVTQGLRGHNMAIDDMSWLLVGVYFLDRHSDSKPLESLVTSMIVARYFPVIPTLCICSTLYRRGHYELAKNFAQHGWESSREFLFLYEMVLSDRLSGSLIKTSLATVNAEIQRTGNNEALAPLILEQSSESLIADWSGAEESDTTVLHLLARFCLGTDTSTFAIRDKGKVDPSDGTLTLEERRNLAFSLHRFVPIDFLNVAEVLASTQLFGVANLVAQGDNLQDRGLEV